MVKIRLKRSEKLGLLIIFLKLYTKFPCNYGLEISFGRGFFRLTFFNQFIFSTVKFGKCFAESIIPNRYKGVLVFRKVGIYCQNWQMSFHRHFSLQASIYNSWKSPRICLLIAPVPVHCFSITFILKHYEKLLIFQAIMETDFNLSLWGFLMTKKYYVILFNETV